MSLKDEERVTLVNLYLEKSAETLEDARLTFSQARWNASANRLYYALFHAITALLISDGIPVHSHNGLKAKFGKEYVLTGLTTEEEGKLLSQMETMRERVEQMIQHIHELVYRDRA